MRTPSPIRRARRAFSGITVTSIQVQWGTNGNPVGTLYLCENTTAGMNSGWTTDAAWNNTGLTPNTPYTYRVKARNGDGVETAWTALGTQSTEYRSLTISATAGGKVSTPGQGVFRYAPGATATLVATPLGGYHFLCWTGSAVDAGRVADPNAAQTTVWSMLTTPSQPTSCARGSTWTSVPPARRTARAGETPSLSLQDALDVAQVGNEIRVAQGTYKPDAGKNVLAGDRLASFDSRAASRSRADTRVWRNRTRTHVTSPPTRPS